MVNAFDVRSLPELYGDLYHQSAAWRLRRSTNHGPHNAVEALATPEQVMAAKRVPPQILFVARLLQDKEPLAAVAIVDRLRLLVPDATVRIVGDGPLRPQCEQAEKKQNWVHYYGHQRGRALRELALASDIALISGRIGLAVLEMASARVPTVAFAS